MGRDGMPSTSPEARALRIRKVLRLVLFLNLIAVSAKLLVWSWTGALSIVAEAAHSGLDALNNIIALAFARIALRGPDEDHPYGHHKFETLGALVVVGLLSITVYELVRGAARRLISADFPPVETPAWAFVVLAGTALFGGIVAWYEAREGRRVGSELLLADAAHTRADVLGTIGVLVGLWVVQLGYPLADPLIALGIAGLITRSGWLIIRQSVPLLVDERGIEATTIRKEAEAAAGVVRTYGIRSRGRPGALFIELTIAVDATLDVEGAHAIADEVEERIFRLGAQEVMVHVEPAE
jgi:cation diffusion facilitator family transporter